MRTRHRMLALGLVAFSQFAAGCQSSKAPAPNVRTHAPGVVNESLVLAANDQSIADWEFARLNAGLGSAASPIVTELNVAVVRQFDNVGVSNGRSRDNSWSFSRGIQVRSAP